MPDKQNKIFVLLFIISIFSNNTFSQTKINGTIKDSNGEPFPSISVLLMQPTDSSIVKFAFSDNNGNFYISFESKMEDLIISISGMIIQSQSKNIKNVSQTVNFIVTEKKVELKEVVVKSTKIWGAKDTVNYLVSAFSSEKDIVIGDVLKKMPGITVAETGQIAYQGEPINKFYIENLDLLGGRYGIATKNISPKDISTVQILENHQPVKALENVKPSSRAAINLKLKDSAKGTLSIMGQLGLGASPLLWNNELTGMYFSRDIQNISTYKGNNSGENLADELRSFTYQNFFGSDNMLNIRMPNPPAISESRYLLNNSNAGTVNTLFKTGEDSELTLNLIYLNDHEKRSGESHTSYYLPGDSIFLFDENMQSSNNTDRMEAEVRFRKNEKDNFLSNYLLIQGEWTGGTGDVATLQKIHQRKNQSVFSIINDFHTVIKKTENKGFEIKSSLGFKSTPQNLNIFPGLYEDMFYQGEAYSAFRQEARINQFYFQNNVTLLAPWIIGKVILSPDFSFNIENKNLHSNMYVTDNKENKLQLHADSLRNDLGWFKFKEAVALDIRYVIQNHLELNVYLPFSYSGIRVNNKITGSRDFFPKPYFEPSMNIKTYLGARMESILNYSFYNQLGDINSFYTGYMMQDYRSLMQFDNRLPEIRGNMGFMSLNYKDVMKMFFAGGNVSYIHQKRNIIHEQIFNDILISTTAVDLANTSENISINGRLSKGFYWKGLVASFDASLSNYSSELLRQGELTGYKNSNLNFSGSLNVKPVSQLILAYKGNWNKNQSRIESQEKFSPMNIFTNTVSADILLSKSLSFNVNYEHYYNNAAIGNKYLSFTDISLDYTVKSAVFSLDWTNIFNAANYITSYFGELNAYRHIYKIRPSMVLLKIKLKIK